MKWLRRCCGKPSSRNRFRQQITYAVNGKQYIAVMTGERQTGTTRPLDQLPGFRPVRGYNAVYVFALP
jgi:hypothetical protein